MMDITQTLKDRDAYLAKEARQQTANRRKRVKAKRWETAKAKRIKQVMRCLGRSERRAEYLANRRKDLPYGTLAKRIKAKWPSVTVEQVLVKFGPSPTCYLTGLPVDYDNGSTYHLEHVKPQSKGGPSTLENMQLAHPMANIIKAEYDLAEFVRLCHLVARKHPLDDL